MLVYYQKIYNKNGRLECVHRTQIYLLPAKVNMEITLEWKRQKSLKSTSFPYLVPGLVYKFEMIWFRKL